MASQLFSEEINSKESISPVQHSELHRVIEEYHREKQYEKRRRVPITVLDVVGRLANPKAIVERGYNSFLDAEDTPLQEVQGRDESENTRPELFLRSDL